VLELFVYLKKKLMRDFRAENQFAVPEIILLGVKLR
jgi:hypothetical protein